MTPKASPASKRTFKVNQVGVESMRSLCSNLTRTTPEWRDGLWCLYHSFQNVLQWKHRISLLIQLAFTYSKATVEKPKQCVKEICPKLTKTPDVVLLSLLLTWNIFYILVRCFHCWLWTSKWQLRNGLNTKTSFHWSCSGVVVVNLELNYSVFGSIFEHAFACLENLKIWFW